jgi:hypothetical protein
MVDVNVENVTYEVTVDETTYITEVNASTIVGNLENLSNVNITTPIAGEGLVFNGTIWINQAGAGSGDMTKVVYDPNNVLSDAFDYNNFINTPTTITAQQALDITTNNNKISFDWDYDYTDLINKPTIPTNNNELTNGAGFITGYTETDPVFVAHPAYNIDSGDITNLNNLSGINTGDVTVTDTAEIDFTLSGQNIQASIKSGSIDETKLDVSVNASLDLADSALQSFTETDPVFSSSQASNITSQMITDLGNLSGINTGDQDLSGKQDNITLTTTGSSGASTLVGATLNIPQYTYTLPTASTSILGGVKVDGTTITITGGIISAITGGSGDVTGPAYEQSFTATASQTSFTLSHTPVAAWVWINGAAQDASTWSISGNNIVLSTASTSGDSVEVYYLSSVNVTDGSQSLTSQTVGGSDGNIVYLSGSETWSQADASAESTAKGMIGLRISSSEVLTRGVYTTTGLTAGAIYYLSTTTGGITTTGPTGTDIRRIIGYALSTTKLFFDPDKSYVQESV